MTTAVHDHQLVLLGADPAPLAQLDLQRAERLAQTRRLREERRLARIGYARPCRCARPLIVDRGHCLACGRELG